jgi:hypothetical protein
VHPLHGRCFHFNVDGRARSTVPGPRHGLRLVLRADHRDYLYSFCHFIEFNQNLKGISLKNNFKCHKNIFEIEIKKE